MEAKVADDYITAGEYGIGKTTADLNAQWKELR